MNLVPWFDRSFDFSQTQNIFPSVVERLAGTPARLAEKLTPLAEQVLTRQIQGKWSVKEHIGHLSDLEPLWQQRLHDILKGEPYLSAADLQNTATHEANHNATPIAGLLQRFRQVRMATLHLLASLTEEQVMMYALHPRLQTPMRTMDLFLFVAEHDDHHLAHITNLLNQGGNTV